MQERELKRPKLASTTPRWKLQNFRSVEELRFFGKEAFRDLSPTELTHDVEWLHAGLSAGESIFTVADVDDSGVWGVMPLRVSQDVLEYNLGGLRLLRANLPHFRLTQGIPTRRTDARRALIDAFDQLGALMPANGVVYLNAIPCRGDLHALLDEPHSPLRRLFHVLKWGGESLHCKIDWTGNIDTYLASLGADSRRNLKRYAKKLFARQELKATVRRFLSPSEAEQFLADGVRVSNRTYQKRDLGLGLSRGSPAESRILFAAERGRFVGHILYVEDQAVAFHYGYVLGGTLFSMEMGYDPSLSQHQVGGVLFFSMLQDLERLQLAIHTIDNLPRVTTFKLRTSNRKEPIRNYYLFKRTARGFALYATLRAMEAAASLAKRLLGGTRSAQDGTLGEEPSARVKP